MKKIKKQEKGYFFDKQSWIFAKTYADKAPHEYIVRGKHTGTDDEFIGCVREEQVMDGDGMFQIFEK